MPSDRLSLTESQYVVIHAWMRKNYGSADRCEMESCNGKSKKFYWAKRQGFPYTKNRENFWMLCASCHTKYDFKPEAGARISAAQRGRKMPKEQRMKLALANTGKVRSREVRISFARSRGFGPVTQRSLDGTFLGLHETVAEASIATGASRSGISLCISGVLKKSGGYKWSREN